MYYAFNDVFSFSSNSKREMSWDALIRDIIQLCLSKLETSRNYDFSFSFYAKYYQLVVLRIFIFIHYQRLKIKGKDDFKDKKKHS